MFGTYKCLVLERVSTILSDLIPLCAISTVQHGDNAKHLSSHLLYIVSHLSMEISWFGVVKFYKYIFQKQMESICDNLWIIWTSYNKYFSSTTAHILFCCNQAYLFYNLWFQRKQIVSVYIHQMYLSLIKLHHHNHLLSGFIHWLYLTFAKTLHRLFNFSTFFKNNIFFYSISDEI